MELFDNWGAKGIILVAGTPLNPGITDGISAFDFGRAPSNDRNADTSFRTWTFSVNQSISTLELRVVDITNLSEIYVDNLVVEDAQAVPEPGTFALLTAGLAIAIYRRRRR